MTEEISPTWVPLESYEKPYKCDICERSFLFVIAQSLKKYCFNSYFIKNLFCCIFRIAKLKS